MLVSIYVILHFFYQAYEQAVAKSYATHTNLLKQMKSEVRNTNDELETEKNMLFFSQVKKYSTNQKDGIFSQLNHVAESFFFTLTNKEELERICS